MMKQYDPSRYTTRNSARGGSTDMMKRYEPNYDPYELGDVLATMDEDPNGAYVKYTDAQAVIDTLVAKNTALLEEIRQAITTEERV